MDLVLPFTDIMFPEFKPFFSNRFSSTSLYILKKYKTSEKIAKMKDFDSIRKTSHERFSYANFIKLKDLAKIPLVKPTKILNLNYKFFLIYILK